MNIAIVGAGVVGQATGKGFARLGHNVLFCDQSEQVCKELVDQGYESLSIEEAANYSTLKAYDIVFFCVPERVIFDAFQYWLPLFHEDNLVVIRSTVPPGTTVMHKHFCFNPEFLREAVAEYEFLNPPGVIIGECCKEHGDKLEALYKPLRVPIHRVDPTTAEFTKVVINSYLACQISFWNQISRVAESIGVNSHEVGMLASYCDSRVSPYGARMHGRYGGKCLPKDLEQLLELCNEKRVWAPLLQSIKYINDSVKRKED
jgi:nucleotide sugar dehydrogenase